MYEYDDLDNDSDYSDSISTPSSSNPFQEEEEEDDDGDFNEKPPLAVHPSTRLVLGLNKYSHDASICAADLDTGMVLFATSKERITRKKHDGGNTASLVEHCLEQLDLDLDNVVRVVMNDHHHRILPLVESDVTIMEWEEGLGINGGKEEGYSDEYNVLHSVNVVDHNKFELSHHLAHAYSAASQCPFDTGMVVVMDGMGETYGAMRKALEEGDASYVSDLTLLHENDDGANIRFVPSDIDERAMRSYFDWREAESVYTFAKKDEEGERRLTVTPVFKRFTEERTPPALYNHGFENMDSLGAVYSRASSHVFGDWNACGKVMGLAPWRGHAWDDDDGVDSEGNPRARRRIVASETIAEPILEGALYRDVEDGHGLRIDRRSMTGMPFAARVDPDMFDDEGKMVREKKYDFDDNDYVPPADADEDGVGDGNREDDGDGGSTTVARQLPTGVALDAIGLASRIQTDLESVAMDFVRHFKEETGETNLCLAGGVALNSVLNGRLCRELGFENTFVPPYPGDDGIAVGCCAFGLYGNRGEDAAGGAAAAMPPLWNETLSPYLGPMPTDAEIREAIAWASPWLEVETLKDEGARNDMIVEELASGGVVAIYDGRSELGPRALGHRSILADPRKKGLVRFINEFVKKRESFRPFAPSCLAEEAGDWFDLGEHAAAAQNNVSPYMSITAQVRESKRGMIPAVTHVDGSSRLQTVTREAEPRYHGLISAFFKATGVPMVLNTSFNTLKGEPIVETPRNAIRSFLSSMGTIEMLVMGDHVIRRKEADVRRLLGEERKDGTMTPPSFPTRAGAVTYQSTFTAGLGGDDDDDSSDARTVVRMPDRPTHDGTDGGWFELLDDLEGQLLGVCDGSVGVNDIMTQFAAMSEDSDYNKITEADQLLFENVVRRLVRLYEHTLISW